MGNAEIGACIDNAVIIDNDGLGGAKGEVDIIGKEKQIDADSEIYYAMHVSENKITIMLDKTNKTPILISS